MTNFFESDSWWSHVSKTLEYNIISKSHNCSHCFLLPGWSKPVFHHGAEVTTTPSVQFATPVLFWMWTTEHLFSRSWATGNDMVLKKRASSQKLIFVPTVMGCWVYQNPARKALPLSSTKKKLLLLYIYIVPLERPFSKPTGASGLVKHRT